MMNHNVFNKSFVLVILIGYLVVSGCDKNEDDLNSNISDNNISIKQKNKDDLNVNNSDKKIAIKQLSIPVDGVWTIPFQQMCIMWEISYDSENGTGTIQVETKGRPIRNLQFTVGEHDQLIISEASRQPTYVISGEMVNMGDIEDLFLLSDPPKSIKFSPVFSETTNPQTLKGLDLIDFIQFNDGDSIPILLESLKDSDRILMPFENVVAAFDLSFKNVTSSVSFDMNPSKGTFDKLIHPDGKVSELSINGKTVEIEDPVLKDGLFKTKLFGDVELVMAGLSEEQKAFMITNSQLKSIAVWLESK